MSKKVLNNIKKKSQLAVCREIKHWDFANEFNIRKATSRY